MVYFYFFFLTLEDDMKHTWEQIHEIWNACGYNEILKKQYKDEMINLPDTIKQLEKEEIVRLDSFEGEGYVRRIYIGSVCGIFPSGKFYMPWTSNQSHRDVYRDEIFREVLEEMLDDEDCSLENGEGSADDLFICKYYDDPFESFANPEKARALASFLELEFDSWEDIQEENSNEFKIGRNKWYLVLTDEEADDAWDESLDNYIEEAVLHEIPERYRAYFDSDSFKEDCKIDGRGQSLSPYDGEENYEVDPESKEGFYIYRTN
jgi:hypothetical protein